MRRYEKKRHEPREYDSLVEMQCDLCQAKSTEDDWTDDYYSVEETTVSHKSGSQYPDSGDYTTMSFDICPKCFKEKLKPWMESQGAKPTVEETDW